MDPPAPTPEFEKVLGHHGAANSPQEYLVKLVGRSHSAAQWIPEAQLSRDSKGAILLSRYNHSPQARHDQPPFYDPLYDTPDCILAEEGGHYLVKWMHLSHDSATWEDEVPDALLDDFRRRQLFQFAPITDKPFGPDVPRDRFEEYSVCEEGLSKRALFTFNFLIANYVAKSDALFANSIWVDQRLPCFAFFHWLAIAQQNVGPFLCILPLARTQAWYDALRQFPDVVAVLYTGSLASRAIARERELVREGHCRFHFLISTTEILFEELELFETIEFEVVAAIDVPLSAEQSSSSPLDKIRSRFKIVQPFAPVVKSLHVFRKYAEFFSSSIVADIIPKSTAKAFKRLKRSLAQYAEEPTAIYEVEDLECPLNEIQNFMVKYVLQQKEALIGAGDYAAAAFVVRMVSVHPFAVLGPDADGNFFSAKQLLVCSDARAASTKMGVLRLLLEKPELKDKRILIATDSSFFRDLLDDYLTSEALKPSVFSDESSSRISTFCRRGTAPPPLQTAQVVIVHDGDWAAWSATLSSANAIEFVYHLESVHLLESEFANMESLPPTSPQFEKYCRNAAFQCLFCKKPNKPMQLLANSSSTSSIVVTKFVEKELASPEFWRRFFIVPRARDFNTFISPTKPTIHEFTLSLRDHFVRTFFALGWRSVDAIVLSSGISITRENAQAKIRRVVRQLLEVARPGFSTELASAFIGTDAEVSVPGVFADRSFCNYLRAHAEPMLDRLRTMHFLSAVADCDDFDFAVPSPPAAWWQPAHDRALARGVCAYGFGNYEFFWMDGSPALLEIVSYHDGTSLSTEVLNDRVTALAAAASEYALSKPFGDFVPSGEWSDEQQRVIFEHIDQFGIEFDAQGEPDVRVLRRVLSVGERLCEPLRAFVSDLVMDASDESPVSFDIRARLRLHIAIMARVREIAGERNDGELRHFLIRAPRWRALGKEWTPVLEQQLLHEILQQGLPAFRGAEFSPFGLTEPLLFERLVALAGGGAPAPEEPAGDGTIELPIQITPCHTVHSLGWVEWERPAFHTERYIYPIGFKSSRMSPSLTCPSEKVRWFSEILDGGDGPLFRVSMEGCARAVYEGSSPTAPWSAALRALSAARRNPSRVASISGPEAFLLASPVVTFLIQRLPGAERCERYVFKDVSEHPLVRRFQSRAGGESESEESEPGAEEPEPQRRRRR
jgi:hypothetical protein